MKKLIIFPLITILLLSFVLADVEYNFLSSTQIYTSPTNNSYIFLGNDNNTWLIFGDMNGTIREMSLTNYSLIRNITGFNANCNFSSLSTNNAIIYKFPDNSSMCHSGNTGSAYFYYPNGTLASQPTLATDSFNGFTTSGTNITYIYGNGGNPLAFSKKIFPTNTAYPALACYSQLSNVFQNNFGINLTLNGGLNQSYASGTLIQHNLSVFYFKVANRWFYFEESNSNDCTEIAQTLNEATLNFPNDTTTTTNRYIIINDDLYQVGKNTNELFLFTSGEVDIYSGLVCASNGDCYNQTGLCLPNNELYDGVNSSNYVCGNVSIIGNDYYCNAEALSYCAGGCVNNDVINSYSVTYSSATCYANASDCSNDCVIEGLTYSDTAISYKRCGFYDADVCLDWSSSIPCADGEYSLNGFCYTLNTSGYDYYSLRAFTSTPNLDLAKSSDLSANPKKASYEFSTSYGVIGVDYNALPTSFYIAKTCDYKTTNIISDLSSRFINDTYSYSLSGYTNGDSKFIFSLPANGSLNFKGLDSLDRQVYSYNVTMNESFGVCVYDNTSLVGCESVPFADIKNIDFTIKTARPSTNQLHSVKLKINRNDNGYQDIYTGFFNVNNPSATNLIKVNVSSSNATITSVNVFNEEQITEPFKNTTWTIINNGVVTYQHTCTYSSVGCRTLRSYYKDDLSEGLWNTQDWNICVNSLNGVSISESSGLFSNYFNSKIRKLFGALLISFGVMMFIVIAGMLMKNESEQRIVIWLGVFAGISGLIAFTIINWVPVWLLIVSGIIASLGVGVFFIKRTSGV